MQLSSKVQESERRESVAPQFTWQQVCSHSSSSEQRGKTKIDTSSVRYRGMCLLAPRVLHAMVCSVLTASRATFPSTLDFLLEIVSGFVLPRENSQPHQRFASLMSISQAYIHAVLFILQQIKQHDHHNHIQTMSCSASAYRLTEYRIAERSQTRSTRDTCLYIASCKENRRISRSTPDYNSTRKASSSGTYHPS